MHVELTGFIEEAEFIELRPLIGHVISSLFELDVPDLWQEAMSRYHSLNPGAIPTVIWVSRYRASWGSRVLEFPGWENGMRDFCDRIGPPDGCNWDGENLDCAWEEAALN